LRNEKYIAIYEWFYDNHFKKADMREWHSEQEQMTMTFKAFYGCFHKWKTRMVNGQMRKAIKKEMNMAKATKLKTELKPLIKRKTDLNLPISKAHKPHDFYLNTTYDNILFLTDIHVPYHDIEALKRAIQYGLDNDVNTIWLNGDIVDFYAISRYDKDPRKRDFGDEIMSVRMLLESLRNIFPDAQIYYKEGNHEQRWLKYIMKNAPDLLALGEFDLPSILKLNEYKIHFIANERLAWAGDLLLLHGNEIRLSGNIAQKLYQRTYTKAICGHHHQTWEYAEPNIKKEFVYTYAVGCLCELHPEYLMYNRHNHGFAHIIIDKGKAIVNNIRIE